MTLRLHRAERTSVLADALADVLSAPLADPFQREVVAVPAKGVERWLNQRLSTVLGTRASEGITARASDGVAANISFPSPTRLVDEAIAAAGGHDADDDPWAPQRVLWQLLDVIDACVGDPWCGVLAGHLGHGAGDDGRGDHRTGRRYAAAEKLRDLYRSYAAHRPQLLVDWVAGDDTDGAGGPLDHDQLWQAELWRRLRAAIDAPSPAERLEQTCERLRAEPSCSDLPERLSLFGATRLTTEQRAVLRALGEHREVHLWLPHPSPAMWQQLQHRDAPTRRRDDHSALGVQHPLLASLARDTRELQLLLTDVDAVHHRSGSRSGTLLGEVQAAIAEDRPPAATAAADGTIQVHACHGPPRQVEVLRESLLHCFQDDPTLEPRDVLVMCPDVETYAPLVKAAFGQPGTGHPHTGHPGHGLRVRLADRSLRQTNPLLDTLATLLGLADGRVTASQVLDLAATAPVRRAFGFSDDDLERLRDWAARAGVRWGLGVPQRQAFSLTRVPQNTWETGLDRLLLGVAADESDLTWLDRALPLDDVDSSDIDLAGRLAELVDRLGAVLDRLQGEQPVADWVAALGDALDLLTEVGDDDAWQLAQARRQLSEAAEHGSSAVLRLADLRVLLAGRLAGRPTRANFRTGELTVCTMVPMRSVPHRVIALLGLDDGVFPRAGSIDGDDVLQRDPSLGERDARSEDRQLLLDALMSASDTLLLLYTGADPVTGATRPPAVPLGELLDVVQATTGSLDGVLRRHPLQPFDARSFDAADPFSFDGAALAGARAAVQERTPVPPLLPEPLPTPLLAGTPADVALRDLIAFLVHPAKALLSRRLGVHVPDAQESVADALQADLDALQKWDVGDRMLAARLAGIEAGAFNQAELRRGTLPPGPLGLRLLAELEAAVEPIVKASLPVHAGVPRALDVLVDLGAGRRLTGTVNGVHGEVLSSTSYSSLGPKHRLTAWVQLLAAGGPTSAVTTGRGPYKRKVWRSTLTLPEDPTGVLRDLVALHDDGLREALPIATGASHAYAARRIAGSDVEDAVEAARKEFESMFGDGKDRHLAYVMGDPPMFDDLLAQPDDGPESTRFGALAVRIWAPLLACEHVGAP